MQNKILQRICMQGISLWRSGVFIHSQVDLSPPSHADMTRRSCLVPAVGLLSALLLVVGIGLVVSQVFRTLMNNRLKKVIKVHLDSPGLLKERHNDGIILCVCSLFGYNFYYFSCPSSDSFIAFIASFIHKTCREHKSALCSDTWCLEVVGEKIFFSLKEKNNNLYWWSSFDPLEGNVK